MKKEIHPAAVIAAIVVLVVGIVVVGYRAMQPAPYYPSPGAGGTPGVAGGKMPGETRQPTAASPENSTYYPSAPPGSTPGKPVGNGQ